MNSSRTTCRFGTFRKLLTDLRAEYQDVWPLQHADLYVPETEIRSGGRHILVRVDNVVADMSDKSPWQFVLETENLRRIATLLQRGGWALHVRPHLDQIEVNPDKLSGRPSIRGTRIAVEDVARIAFESGHAVLREDYGLTKKQISDAEAWWETVVMLQRAA